MSNYGVKELTWENGQLTVHGLGDEVEPTTSNNPIWTQSLNGCETLESVVHQAALQQPSKFQLQSPMVQTTIMRARMDLVQENAVILKKWTDGSLFKRRAIELATASLQVRVVPICLGRLLNPVGA